MSDDSVLFEDCLQCGEFIATQHGGEWLIAHLPGRVIVGALPGGKLASVAHALRALGGMEPCPGPQRLSRCISWWMGYDAGHVDEAWPVYQWADRALTALRRVQGQAWGYDPNEPPPDTWETPGSRTQQPRMA